MQSNTCKELCIHAKPNTTIQLKIACGKQFLKSYIVVLGNLEGLRVREKNVSSADDEFGHELSTTASDIMNGLLMGRYKAPRECVLVTSTAEAHTATRAAYCAYYLSGMPFNSLVLFIYLFHAQKEQNKSHKMNMGYVNTYFL